MNPLSALPIAPCPATNTLTRVGTSENAKTMKIVKKTIRIGVCSASGCLTMPEACSALPTIAIAIINANKPAGYQRMRAQTEHVITSASR